MSQRRGAVGDAQRGRGAGVYQKCTQGATRLNGENRLHVNRQEQTKRDCATLFGTGGRRHALCCSELTAAEPDEGVDPVDPPAQMLVLPRIIRVVALALLLERIL